LLQFGRRIAALQNNVQITEGQTMALDVYQQCPGGIDRKIKFCGCKDILGDLNDMAEAVNSGQRAAVLSRVNSLLETNGSRACLLALKGTVQSQAGDFTGLAKTTEEFLDKFPENPVAFGLSAIVAATTADSDTAIDHLQRALAGVVGGMHEIIYEAIGFVGHLLLQQGDLLAAQGHLILQSSFMPEEDSRAFESLIRLHASPQMPLLLKQNIALVDPPENASWKERGENAMTSAHHGAWVDAIAEFCALAEENSQEPALWKNIAVLHGRLGREQDAAKAWRAYASCEAVLEDDAVDAEALAQLLSASEEEMIHEVSQTYQITDAERALERLLSEKYVAKMPVDLNQLAEEDSPPPKGAFWLLDRTMPATGKGLKLDDVPNVLGEMYLYGKETDRDARLEFVVEKTAEFETKTSALRDLLGELGGPVQDEETVGEVPAADAALRWRWRLPNDTPMEEQRALIEEKRRDINLNQWPETPISELDGKRPAEVAGDPAYRVRLLAAILLLELAGEQSRSRFDFNELRAKLGLPTRVDIEPDGVDIAELPFVGLHLVPPEKLSDDDLATAYQRALMAHATRAILRFGAEVVKRASLRGKFETADVYDAMARAAFSADEALEYTDKAREAAVAAGQSPAPHLLRELDLRLTLGEGEECSRLIYTLQTNHVNEPGVAQALHSLFVQMGMITPDGKLTEAAMQHQRAQQAAVSGDQGTGELWTPDGATAPTEDKEKPSIWVPGMD
jgi:tetratricopeptide (TPR) repeat protein